MSIIILVIVAVMILIGFVALAVFFLTSVLGSKSGIGELEKQYVYNGDFSGEVFRRQTVNINGVYWKNCVDVFLEDAGLGLKIETVAKKTGNIIIPWEQIKFVGSQMLYWQNGCQFEIGKEKHLIIVNEEVGNKAKAKVDNR